VWQTCTREDREFLATDKSVGTVDRGDTGLDESIVEIPVWMKSAGMPRAYGLMAAPVMSRRFSGTISGPPSIGLPPPDRIRPSISLPTGILMVSPVKRTPLSLPIPVVVSKTWTTTRSSLVSRTWPRLIVPS